MQSSNSSFVTLCDIPTSPLAKEILPSYFPSQGPKSLWSRIRQTIREPMAELAGVAIFILFGTGVNCSVALSRNREVSTLPKGDFLSVNFGWAIGLAMGAWVSGGISGGHLNPAVTLTLATWRGFPWRKVPAYIFAQVLGGVIGAGLVYGNYVTAINIFEGGSGTRTLATADLFATYALDYMSDISCFFTGFLGTVVLVFVVLAAADKKNDAVPKGLRPLTLFLALLGVGAAFGMQTSYTFNPARDLGPRLFLTMAGYGKQLYVYRNHYWLWCGIIAPCLGAQAAVGLYDLFLNEEDPLNRKTVY